MKRALLLTLPIIMLGCTEMTPEQHIEQAQLQISAQNYDAAVIELKNALQLAPSNPETRFLLGSLYLEQKDYRSAEKELSKALDLGYPASEVLPLLSQALDKTQADVALANLKLESQGLDDNTAAEIAYLKLQSMLRLNQQEDAERLIKRIKLYDTDSHYKRLAEAYALVLNDQREEALVQIEQVLSVAPGNEHALQQKASIQLQLRQLEPAIDTFKKLLDYHPDDLDSSFILARLLVESNRASEAETYIDKLLEVNAEHGLLNYYKAMARFNANDYPAASDYVAKAITDDPASPQYRLLAGYAAYAQEDFKNTESHLALIATELPAGHPGLKVLAASQLKLGMNQAAGDTLERLEQPAKNDLELFTLTSFELLREGHISQAEALIKQTQDMGESAQELARLGILQLSVNDMAGIEKLEKAVELNPELQQAYASLAVAYLRQEQWQKANELAEKWQQALPDSPRPLMLKGLLAKQSGQTQQAKAFYQQAAKLAPDELSTEVLIAELEAEQGDLNAAIKRVEAIVDANPEYIPAVARMVKYKMANNNASAAIDRVKQIQQAHPDNLSLRLLLASAYSFEQKFNQVVPLLQQAEVNPPPELFSRLLGTALLRTNKVKEAADLYRAWYQRQPENRYALNGQIGILRAQNRPQDALDLIQSHAQKFGQSQYTWVISGLLNMRLGNVEKAKSAFKELSEQTRNSVYGQSLQAQLAMQAGNCQQAIPFAQQAYQTQPTHEHIRMLVICHEATQQADKAMTLLNAHIKRFPDDQLSQLLMAERTLGQKPDQAIEIYKNLIASNPKNAVALNNLAYLYMQKNQYDQAEKYARDAVALFPEQADILDTLGEILLKQGDSQEALSLLTKAVNQGTQNQVIWLHYIQALIAEDQLALAKRKLSQYEFSDPRLTEQLEAIKQQLN